jgi:predicted kinase
MERAPMLREREAAGSIRDGHGDLHAAQIWVDHEIEFIDCIEFSSDYRCGDVALDLAFLAMDLDHYGRPDLEAALVEAYVQFSKDEAVRELLAFFKCYRAYVRAKVASITLDNAELGAEQHEAVASTARSYYRLAHDYAMSSLPERWLFVVMGLPGTGKSTLAEALADHWRLPLVSSDVERKRLAGVGEGEHRYAAFGEGLYSKDVSSRTYEALMERAAVALAGGSVVLDATFREPEHRRAAVDLAKRAGATAWLIECTAPTDVVRRRIEKRVAEGADPSDATWAVYERQRDEWVEVREVDDRHGVIVDTNSSAEDVLRRTLERVFGSEVEEDRKGGPAVSGGPS